MQPTSSRAWETCFSALSDRCLSVSLPISIKSWDWAMRKSIDHICAPNAFNGVKDSSVFRQLWNQQAISRNRRVLDGSYAAGYSLIYSPRRFVSMLATKVRESFRRHDYSMMRASASSTAHRAYMYNMTTTRPYTVYSPPTCKTKAAAVVSSGNQLPSTACSTNATNINTIEATPVDKHASRLLRLCRDSFLGKVRPYRPSILLRSLILVCGDYY